MCRRYEDPHKLEEELVKAKEALKSINPDTHWYEYVDLSIHIEDIRQRINFAWQDIEYDESEKEI
jgi:hypothetical protein